MKVVLITLPKFLMANLFQEGGSLFMSLILISLLASIAFLIKGFLSLKNGKLSKKMLALAGDSGLLGMVLGFFGVCIRTNTSIRCGAIYREYRFWSFCRRLKSVFIN